MQGSYWRDNLASALIYCSHCKYGKSTLAGVGNFLLLFLYGCTRSKCWHRGSLLQWDLSSLTRDWTRAPCIGSMESKPLGHQGSPKTLLVTMSTCGPCHFCSRYPSVCSIYVCVPSYCNWQPVPCADYLIVKGSLWGQKYVGVLT